MVEAAHGITVTGCGRKVADRNARFIALVAVFKLLKD